MAHQPTLRKPTPELAQKIIRNVARNIGMDIRRLAGGEIEMTVEQREMSIDRMPHPTHRADCVMVNDRQKITVTTTAYATSDTQFLDLGRRGLHCTTKKED